MFTDLINDIHELYNVNYTIHNKSTYKAIVETISIISTMKWNSLKTYFSNVTQVTKRDYDISYSLNDQNYIIRIKASGMPKKILKIFNEEGKDVSDIIFPYLGPSEDFHNIPVNPKTFGFKELCFIQRHGEELRFKETERIKL